MGREQMMDRRGQGALFDAMAFLVIMLVASSSLSAYSGALARDARTASAASEIEYARSMLESLARTTVAGSGYTLDGEAVAVGDSPAGQLLTEELAVLVSGAQADFSALNSKISDISEALADGREWALECRYEDASGVVTTYTLGAEPPAQRFSSSMEPLMAGGFSGRASIVLFTWRS